MPVESYKKKINQLVRMAKCCPVTGNMPTEMTSEAFADACEAARRKEMGVGFLRSKRKIIETWCDTCQGRSIPKGLKIITKERALAKRFTEQRRRAA